MCALQVGGWAQPCEGRGPEWGTPLLCGHPGRGRSAEESPCEGHPGPGTPCQGHPLKPFAGPGAHKDPPPGALLSLGDGCVPMSWCCDWLPTSWASRGSLAQVPLPTRALLTSPAAHHSPTPSCFPLLTGLCPLCSGGIDLSFCPHLPPPQLGTVLCSQLLPIAGPT